jgi:hypothetical protein
VILIFAVLCAVIVGQSWLLLKAESPTVTYAEKTANQLNAVGHVIKPGTGENGVDQIAEMAERLEEINLKVNEIKRETHDMTHPNTKAVLPESLSPEKIAAGDRRFAAMFPEKQFDRHDMTRLQFEASKLSADEQLQLMTAFYRALNSDRIKLLM